MKMTDKIKPTAAPIMRIISVGGIERIEHINGAMNMPLIKPIIGIP